MTTADSYQERQDHAASSSAALARAAMIASLSAMPQTRLLCGASRDLAQPLAVRATSTGIGVSTELGWLGVRTLFGTGCLIRHNVRTADAA